MVTTVDFVPHVPLALFWTLAVIAAALFAYAVFRRAPGSWGRGLALGAMLLVLSNPLIVRERREPLTDIAAVVVDRSQSMGIGTRGAEAARALQEIKKRLGPEKDLELRVATVTTQATGEENGTQLFTALGSTLADVSPDRIAGAILITDGEVHDAPKKPPFRAPIQALIVGRKNERDRKLTVVDAARFAIVDQDATLVLRVDDFGAPSSGTAELEVRIDGRYAGTRTVPVGKDTTIHVPIGHGGENVVEVEARPGPSELTLQNNRAVSTVSGVRDRLRVLLVSGEPHAGERVWRSLLKADPSVDLVHFTILRPPDKQDFTPIDELSLIAFPTRELFVEKLSQFDLVIFDRYRERGILPLAYFENLAGYVENGGALLVSAGPEFAEPTSIYRTPLASVLPAAPTGDIVTQGFRPLVTQQGQAHPVTSDLPGANTADTPPSWGRWFRLIGANKVTGETVMSGPDNRPLLVLDRIGKGRVAEFLSDQGWLWARGYEGGGPESELLRRLAHWLMKEPELEEERLTATTAGGVTSIERRTMSDRAAPVTLISPSGKKRTVVLRKMAPGIWRASVKVDELGLYRLSDGRLAAVTAAGPLNPREVADMRATGSIVAPVAEASGGSVHWLSDGMPAIRRVAANAQASAENWIGLRRNGAYRVTAVEQEQLLPPWAGLMLLIGTLALAWRLEGR
jgi:hypothetical protein